MLPGDFDGNGVVNGKDLTAIHNEWKGKDGAQPTIFGEILGDGSVSASDYQAARKFNGARLPKLPKTGGKPPKTIEQTIMVRPRLTALDYDRSGGAIRWNAATRTDVATRVYRHLRSL